MDPEVPAFKPKPIGAERAKRGPMVRKSFQETEGGRICFRLNADLLRDLEVQEVCPLLRLARGSR